MENEEIKEEKKETPVEKEAPAKGKEKKSQAAKELEKKLESLEKDLAKEKDDYLRLMAEFDNYRRRTSQEKLDLVSMAAVDTIKGLLPILDDFERALKVLGESGDSDAAKEGTQLSLIHI